MTRLAAPPPRAVAVTTEPSSVLEKRVQARGKCTPDGEKSKVSATNDPWFPVDLRERELEKAAHKACDGCPVKDSCRELALRMERGLPQDLIHGVLGGLAPHQRIAANKARRARSGEVAR